MSSSLNENTGFYSLKQEWKPVSNNSTATKEKTKTAIPGKHITLSEVLISLSI